MFNNIHPNEFGMTEFTPVILVFDIFHVLSKYVMSEVYSNV